MLKPTDYYLLRFPLYPYKNLQSLNQAIDEKDIKSIKSIFSDQLFLNGIFLSSKEFYKTALAWILDTKGFDEDDRLLASLYKYYNRMCTRSTPYGLFAGFNTGKISDNNSDIQRHELAPYQLFIRPDMLLIENLKQIKLNDNKKIVANTINYFPNNTVYKIGDSLRYIELDAKKYKISEIAAHELLTKILLFTERGKTTNEIKEFIEIQEPGSDENSICEFISELIDSQVIVTKIPPYLTNTTDILESLYTFAQNSNIWDGEIAQLDAVGKDIRNAISTNTSIAAVADKYDLWENNDQDFQVDVMFNLKNNNINKKIIDSIAKTINELQKIESHYKISTLEDFKNRFLNRYEAEEVCLVDVIDPNIGIGYDLQVSGNIEYMPLIEGVEFAAPTGPESIINNRFVEYVNRKFYEHFSFKNIDPIILEEIDINNNIINDKPSSNPFEDYYLLGEFISQNIKELDKGNFKFHTIYSIPSPLSASVLSRFAYYDKELEKKIRGQIDTEESDYLYAEVVHQPEGRIGNILLRSNIYAHEIPYVTQANPSSHEIPIQDLFVSIRNNKIVIRSRRLNKQILPRLSSAHNFQKEQLPLFRFLCDLQYDGKQKGFKWDWGQLESNIYLPRVEYKNIILSQARWRISAKKDIDIDKLKGIIKELNIPNNCTIKQGGDNILRLDLSNSICLNIIVQQLKKRDIIIFESLVNTPFLEIAKDFYFSEFIFSLTSTQQQKPPKGESSFRSTTTDKVQRVFFPGDEWAYYKIYCSHAVGDSVIAGIANGANEFFEDNDDPIWFFIRYQDPEYHIRFRIKSDKQNNIINIIKDHLKILIDDKLVFSITQDTYKREIERYGIHNIENSEYYFFHDSVCAAQLIERIKEHPMGEDVRWIVAILSIDLMLDDFDISYFDRMELMRKSFDSFQAEFVDQNDSTVKKAFKKSIDRKIRTNQALLLELIAEKKFSDEYEEFSEILYNRSKTTKSLISKIKESNLNKEILLNHLQSYIHMNLNRIFFSQIRMHETVIYFLLFKTYTTIVFKKNG
jgi:thiopeptide-type bacteriocin biosynthesis protein